MQYNMYEAHLEYSPRTCFVAADHLFLMCSVLKSSLMQLYVGPCHVVGAEIAVATVVPIENSADCEVGGVIRFLQEKNVRPCDILCRLVTIYGEGVMNAASVRKYCIMFENGRTDVHDEERSGRPSVITGALIQKVERII